MDQCPQSFRLRLALRWHKPQRHGRRRQQSGNFHDYLRPRGKVRHRLPGVVDSFIQWCERAREDFQLSEEIEAQLRQRKAKLVLNHTYRQWRAMQKDDPTMCRMMGFKDDPRKSDSENLQLGAETIPIWRPGHPMRRGR